MLTSSKLRVGNGVDIHPLVKGKKLILGGVHIKHDYGCDGHSDGDVLIHSIMDAILGALDKGDIGDHFPSSDNQYKDADSIKLLSDIYYKYIDFEWDIANIDSTIILQEPIVKPYIEKMKVNIQKALSCEPPVSIKATTTDHLGFIGEKKGIAVISTCLLIKDNG
jgi:2-C-methyl-D-erythritol 2,4-cyclodiphosphate synthase